MMQPTNKIQRERVCLWPETENGRTSGSILVYNVTLLSIFGVEFSVMVCPL